MSIPATQSLRQLLPFLKPYRWQVILASLALMFTAVVMLAMGKGIQLLIDGGIASGSSVALTQSVVIFMGLVVLLSLGSFCRFYLVSWIGERVVADMRQAVFSHLISLHPGYFEDNPSGEIQSRLTADTALLQSVIGSSVSIALRNALMLIGGIIFLFITNAKLTLIVLICVPLVIVPILFFGRKVRTLSRTSQDEIANIGHYVGEALRHLKVVQSYNHESEVRSRFYRVTERAFDVSVARIQQRAWLSVMVIFLSMSAIGVMLWVGGNDVIQGTITAGALASFLFYAIIVAGAVAAISEVMGELQRAAGATERLIELLQTPSTIIDGDETAKILDGAALIGFYHVSFAYPSRLERQTLSDINLEIRAGETIAIVGPSGAGKSTLFELLLRFYDTTQGHITVFGQDIRSVSLASLRHHIAIVPQQPALFQTSIADNIAYGNRQASQLQIETAARAANAHEFILALPEGYDTQLGENGIRLSGGQRQRIAIARAVLKNAPILLLDEATSALDAQSEHDIQMALQTLMQHKTTLVIAHRLSTVLNADRTLVIDQGQLVAVGRHHTLLTESPLYARLAALQFDTAGEDQDKVIPLHQEG